MRLRWFPGVWTETTSQGDCAHAVCDNITCIVPGTGAVTHWVMLRECPDPLPLVFTSKKPPATKALKGAWQRGDKSHKLSRHCWFGGCIALRVYSHMGHFSWCKRLVSALCYLASISRSYNHCVASTIVTSAAKPLVLLGFNLPILFPFAHHRGPSLRRMVLSS